MANCLDLKCPACGGTDQIDIAVSHWSRVTETGTDGDLSGDHGEDFDGGSAARCCACDHYGQVADFEPDEVAS